MLELFSHATAAKQFGDKEAEAARNIDTTVFKKVLKLIDDHVVATFNSRLTEIEQTGKNQCIMSTAAFKALQTEQWRASFVATSSGRVSPRP